MTTSRFTGAPSTGTAEAFAPTETELYHDDKLVKMSFGDAKTRIGIDLRCYNTYECIGKHGILLPYRFLPGPSRGARGVAREKPLLLAEQGGVVRGIAPALLATGGHVQLRGDGEVNLGLDFSGRFRGLGLRRECGCGSRGVEGR